MLIMASLSLSKYLLMFLFFIALFITQVEMFSVRGGDVDQYYMAASKPTTASISKKIIVSKEPGFGNYTTIQAAIDQGVPENNAQWIHIYVTTGFYGEQVVVPENKPYIFLDGDPRGTLVYFNCSGDIFNATLSVKASNFFARKMVFKNPMNKARSVEDVNNERQQAVAAQIGGDKVAFDHCSFLGIQDTLFDQFGRHYFYKCYIEGYVDFIFGSGQSIYEGCHIYVTTGDSEYSGAGFITANRRNNVNDSSGFVFSHCIVEGNAQAYLGRPWGPFSRVFFFQSNFSSAVDPSGWDAWKYVSQEHQLMFAEMNCYGPGADTSRRVKWEKQLTLNQAHRLVGNGFMNSDGWLGQLPIPLKLGDN